MSFHSGICSPLRGVLFSSFLVTLVSFGFPEITRAGDAFLRGDVNNDGRISLTDSLMLRRYFFTGAREPTCRDAADFNDDGVMNLSDMVGVAGFAFLGRNPPAAPYPAVGVDPTDDDLGCERYEVVEPGATDDVVRLGDVSGEEIEIPVFVTNAVEVEGFQLVVSYDPQVFTPLESDSFTESRQGITFDGTFYDGRLYDRLSFTVLTSQTEGTFVVAFSPNYAAVDSWEERDERTVLPVSETETLVFKIVGTIAPDAEEGTTVSMEPTNGPAGEGTGPLKMRNELTSRGDVRFVSTMPKLAGMVLQIVGDLSFFRGDSNGDDSVDVSDAQYTLNYLFIGADAPPCMDAADANDDGSVNVADPISTLILLFSGGSQLPPPYPEAGHDPTEDALACERA